MRAFIARRTKVLLRIGAALALLWGFSAAFLLALHFNMGPWAEGLRQRLEMQPCLSNHNSDDQIECIFRVLGAEMKAYNVSVGMNAFAVAYDMSPAFVESGCHKQAHRMGDIAYFTRYVGREDFDDVEFPQSTTACGYGFFHGFLEHLIQDHPDPAFVDQTCAYLTQRLGETMGDIRLTCYHGSGHGFVLAQIETLKTSEWGNMRKFTDAPIKKCLALTGANATDREQCMEGIFNVVVDSASGGLYGFTYDLKHPFRACDALPSFEWRACYYEMSQKLDKPSNLDPVKLAALTRQAITPALGEMAFKVGIAGIVQQIIADGTEYRDLVDRCGELSDNYFSICMESVSHGLFEHGEPQKEYEKALDACHAPAVAAHDAVKDCYDTVSKRLPRFYSDEKIDEICAHYPTPYQEFCKAQKGRHSTDTSPNAPAFR